MFRYLRCLVVTEVFFTSNVKVCIIIKKDLQSLPKCIIFELTIKRNKMTYSINNLTIEKETEKAICVVVCKKLDDNGTLEYDADGCAGFFKNVTCWFPKSQIKADGQVPAWLIAAKQEELKENGTRINLFNTMAIA